MIQSLPGPDIQTSKQIVLRMIRMNDHQTTPLPPRSSFPLAPASRFAPTKNNGCKGRGPLQRSVSRCFVGNEGNLYGGVSVLIRFFLKQTSSP